MLRKPFVVEHDVPLPDEFYKPRAKVKYPIKDLELWDSFFVPGMTPRELKNATRIPRSWLMEGQEFEFAAANKDGIEGARCWRTK